MSRSSILLLVAVLFGLCSVDAAAADPPPTAPPAKPPTQGQAGQPQAPPKDPDAKAPDAAKAPADQAAAAKPAADAAKKEDAATEPKAAVNSMQADALRASFVPQEELAICSAGIGARTGTGEGLSALVTAAIPAFVDAGFAFLSAAFKSASGVDNKTVTSQAVATSMLYALEPISGDLNWALQDQCLVVEGGPENNFKAVFGIGLSPDLTAYRLDLFELTYPQQLRKGRKVEGMALSVSIRDSAQQVISSQRLPN